jgi:phenylacetate-coenzyme A ligase PaaK-like adenylate-forming protein
MPNAPPYQKRRLEHIAHLWELAGPMIERIDWSPERLEAHREQQLRALLRHVRTRSPWHARRLAALDADSATAADLTRLPPMTKADLMAHWDEIVTDPRLSLARCEDHLDRLSEPAYLEGEYHAVASAGSSGRRGVFVYGWDEWAICYASLARWLIRGIPARGRAFGQEMVVTTVAASAPTHQTSAIAQTFAMPGQKSRWFPVNRPLAEIVAGLNQLQPDIVMGYASPLHALACEALAGRLGIQPCWVWCASEPLFPEMAEALQRAWGLPPVNIYGTSDAGIMGSGCGHAPGIHLNDDLVIVEPVRADGSPVGPGETSAKLYVTALMHHTLPVIRYELTDEVTPLEQPCPCGSHFRRIGDIQGRLDDSFRYGPGVSIHPHVFRSPLSRRRNIVEYQVRQTECGAEIDIRTLGPVASEELASEISQQLEGAGLARPAVAIHRVASIERLGIGKLKRFVPLRRDKSP